MNRVAVIDADIFLYKACRVGEREVDWGDEQWILWSDLNTVKTIIDDQISLVVEQMEADRLILCFSDKANFRKEINPEYKAHRKGDRKPMCFLPALAYCKDKYPYQIFPTLEADDTIGIIGTTPSKTNEYVIVSDDKDLLTIPGLHWDKELKLVYAIDKETADFNFYAQTLVGDPVDNYKGCPKVGKVTAEKILRKAEREGQDLWSAVVETYEKAHMTKEDALLNARMARILRNGEYNRQTHEVNLFEGEV